MSPLINICNCLAYDWTVRRIKDVRGRHKHQTNILLQVDWPIFEDGAKEQSKLPYVRNNV